MSKPLTDSSPPFCPALENLPVPVLLADSSYLLRHANRAARGIKPEEDWRGQTCYRFVHDYDRPCSVPLAECPIRSFFEAGETLTVAGKCCGDRTVSSFDAGHGLVGLLVGTKPAPECEEQRMIHTGKMAALGAMLAHIVHNLNSSFYVTANYLGVLRKKLEGEMDRAEIGRCLARIDDANQMATGMARTLLDYTRQQDSQQLVYARQAVDEVLNLLSSALAAAGITPRVTGVGEGPELDRQSLLTVLFNVIQNAIEAMPAGGGLEIEIAARAVTISDQGIGITAENLKKIFAPYFTTSATGTGLGLFIARRMMHALGGEIEAESRSGEGTTIKLVFHEQAKQK